MNSQAAGSIWKPAYMTEVTRLLRNGANHLRIVVYNTVVNELSGRTPPDYGLLNQRYGQHFVPQDIEDWKPSPSGLLGAPQIVVSDK